MGCATHVDVNGEFVAADDAGRRVQDDGMTDGSPFRVQRLLHPQRPQVLAADQEGRRVAALEAEMEAGLPGGGGDRFGGMHPIIIAKEVRAPDLFPCPRRYPGG